MNTRIWFMAPLVLGLLLGCTEKQIGKISNLVNPAVPTKGKEKALTAQGKHRTFSGSVEQEITAIEDYFSNLKQPRPMSSQLLSKKEQGILKSAKTFSQEGKALQRKGKSYRALQKVRTAKKMINPMMKNLWKVSDKRAVLGLVNQQIDVVKQRHHELEDLVGPGKVKSKKAINARQRSKALFDEAKKLRMDGKLRRAYVQSEEALEALDAAIAVVWHDRNS